MIGQRIGNYVVRKQLGQGGMGQVFLAENESIRGRVAIKVLQPQYSRNRDIAARFLNEALAVNVVGDPGIVRVIDHGHLYDGTPYIVMEFLEGESLQSRMDRHGGKLGMEALRLAQQIAKTLAAAHRHGIIHRDLKPENVMIVRDSAVPGGERAKILDFGIAKLTSRIADPNSTRPAGQIPTQVGAIMGTRRYMAPEQCVSAHWVTDRADVYSLGVMLYELLSGRHPFCSGVSGEPMVANSAVQPPSLRQFNPAVSRPLEVLAQDMLAYNPAERPTMEQVASMLDALASGETHDPQKRASWLYALTGLGLGMLLMAVTIVKFFRPPVPSTTQAVVVVPSVPPMPSRVMQPSPDVHPTPLQKALVHIRARPETAIVEVDGRRCDRPCEVQLLRNTSLRARVHNRGYDEYEKEVLVDRDPMDLTVDLHRIDRQHGSPKPPTAEEQHAKAFADANVTALNGQGPSERPTAEDHAKALADANVTALRGVQAIPPERSTKTDPHPARPPHGDENVSGRHATRSEEMVKPLD